MERTININQSSLKKEHQILEKVNEETSKISPNQIHFRFFELKNTANRKMHKRDDLREIQQLKISLDTDEDIIKIGRETDFIKINETYLRVAKLQFDDSELEGYTELNFTLIVELKNENITQVHKIKAPVESFKKKEWNCVMMTLFDDALECNFISESDPEFFANSNSGDVVCEQGTITESLPEKGDSDEFVSPNNSFISPIRYEINRINEEKEINYVEKYNDIKDCFERFENSFSKLNLYLSDGNKETLYRVMTQKLLNPFLSQIEEYNNGSDLKTLKESLDDKELRLKLNDTEAIIHLLIKIYSDLTDAFKRFILNDPLFVELTNFGRFYELLRKLRLRPQEKEEILKQLEDYNKYTDREDFKKLKDGFNKPQFQTELDNSINKTCENLFNQFVNMLEDKMNAIKIIMKHLKERCLFEVNSIFLSIEDFGFNNFNPNERQFSARNLILKVKFSTYIIKYNMEAIFFNKHKSLIQKNFIILTDLENEPDLDYIKIVKTSYERVLKLLRSLDSGDDLFNYLSFLTSDIIEMKNQLVFKFTPKNTFSRLKKLFQKNMFDDFILYEYEPIENPIFPQKKSNIQQNEESDDQVAFVENVLLNRVCCLDISLMSENVSVDLKIEKYSLIILHEIVHLLLYEKNITLDSRFLGTPLIEKLLKDQSIKKADSGDMLEFLMADKLVDSFLKDKRDYIPEFFDSIRNPENLKGNLISFIDSLKNRNIHANPPILLPTLPPRDPNIVLNDNHFIDQPPQFTSSIFNSRSHSSLSFSISHDNKLKKKEYNLLIEEDEIKINNVHLDNSLHLNIQNLNQGNNNLIQHIMMNSDHIPLEMNLKTLDSQSDSGENNTTRRVEVIDYVRSQNESSNFPSDESEESYSRKKTTSRKNKFISKGDKIKVSKEGDSMLSEAKEDKNEKFDIKKDFECYSSKFETHFSIKLEDYFCPGYKKRVLGILYVCDLKPVERKFPRDELFGKIFDSIINLLEELKKMFPRKMRMMYNQNTINHILRILERIYNINNN